MTCRTFSLTFMASSIALLASIAIQSPTGVLMSLAAALASVVLWEETS